MWGISAHGNACLPSAPEPCKNKIVPCVFSCRYLRQLTPASSIVYRSRRPFSLASAQSRLSERSGRRTVSSGLSFRFLPHPNGVQVVSLGSLTPGPLCRPRSSLAANRSLHAGVHTFVGTVYQMPIQCLTNWTVSLSGADDVSHSTQSQFDSLNQPRNSL